MAARARTRTALRAYMSIKDQLRVIKQTAPRGTARLWCGEDLPPCVARGAFEGDGEGSHDAGESSTRGGETTKKGEYRHAGESHCYVGAR